MCMTTSNILTILRLYKNQLRIIGTHRKEGKLVMNKELFDKLVNKATEMALANKWGEKT